MTPLWVLKTNIAGPEWVPSLTMNPLPPLKTMPVGPPGTVTTRGTTAPVASYSVDVFVRLLFTHHGVDGPATRLQAFTRFGSTPAATPARSSAAPRLRSGGADDAEQRDDAEQQQRSSEHGHSSFFWGDRVLRPGPGPLPAVRHRPEEIVRDELADLVTERLPGILVVTEGLARVDAARCRLVGGLRI